MPDPAAFPARVLVLVVLWAPLALWLMVIEPVEGSLPTSHALAASALVVVGERLLQLRYELGAALPAQDRFRVVPRHPRSAQVSASVALSLVAFATWRSTTLDPQWTEWAAGPAGVVLLWMAERRRRDPIWGTWLELERGLLRVGSPAGSYEVATGQIRSLRYRERDGSFLVTTPWPERDMLVLTARARRRYVVERAAELFAALAEQCPAEPARGLVPSVARRWS